jgi:hypothetical protein
MALRKTTKFQNSFGEIQTIEDCYIRVDSLNGSKNYIGAIIGLYKSQNNKAPIKITGYWFEPKLEGKNFIAQAYDHLKTLPEFSGAIDC